MGERRKRRKRTNDLQDSGGEGDLVGGGLEVGVDLWERIAEEERKREKKGG
jgi:hypothetical protein